MRVRLFSLVALLALAWAVPGVSARAQFVPPALHDNFIDTSILRPPAGSSVAILVWEDLGCPACRYWHPIEEEVAKKYGVTLVRRDFPLAAHVWTFEAAVDARYLKDKVSVEIAEQYRSDVFFSQASIMTKDDLHAFNAKWMATHGLKTPAALDPDGALAKEVQADYDLGKRLNVEYTPTIVVVTNSAYQAVAGLADGNKTAEQFDAIVKAAREQAGPDPGIAKPAAKSAVKKPVKKVVKK